MTREMAEAIEETSTDKDVDIILAWQYYHENMDKRHSANGMPNWLFKMIVNKPYSGYFRFDAPNLQIYSSECDSVPQCTIEDQKYIVRNLNNSTFEILDKDAFHQKYIRVRDVDYVRDGYRSKMVNDFLGNNHYPERFMFLRRDQVIQEPLASQRIGY